MSSQPKKWIVRAKQDEHILGPFSLQKMHELLRQGVLTGQELIAEYPGGNWKNMSSDPQVYDLVLEALGAEGKKSGQKGKLALVPIHDTKPGVESGETTAVLDQANIELESPGTFSSGFQPDQTQKLNLTRTKPLEGTQLTRTKPLQTVLLESEKTRSNPPLLLTSQEPPVRSKKSKLVPFLLIALALVALCFALQPPTSSTARASGRIALLRPQWGGVARTSQSQKYVVEGWGHFYEDSFTGYLAAQEKFVQASEAYNMNPDALAMLLMTYLELWPFAKQDSQDQMTVESVFLQLSKAAPFGVSRAMGAGAYNLIVARDPDARAAVDSGLQENASEGRLYALKARLLYESGLFTESLAYYEKVKSLIPHWSKSSYMMGLCMLRLGNFAGAAQAFVDTLKANSKHVWSRLELGILEGQFFNHPEKAREYITAALDSDERFLPASESRARFILANQCLKNGDVIRAKQQATLASSLAPTDPDVRELVERLGGGRSPLASDERQYMANGDQYMREKNYLAAQAQFKAAFAANPKNARAAYRTAEALWSLHQMSDALNYLKLAITSDPKDVASYVLLAEYQGRRHDYESAAAALESARKLSPKSYEVHRGYAELFLRRGDAKSAEVYASQALKFYDSDIKTNSLMSQIQLAGKDVVKAVQYGKKAVDLDRNNAEAHVTLAKALVAFQGAKQGIEYLTNLINTYPTDLGLRMGLAEIYLNEEQYAAAQPVLQQVVRADPANKEAYLLLGTSYFLNNDAENALSAFLAAARIDPSDPSGLFKAGEVYLKAERPQEAQRQFAFVIRSNPLFPLAHYNMARAYQGMSQGDLALKEIELEKRNNPNMIAPYDLAGDLFLNLKKFPMAAKEFQKVIELNPNGGASPYIKLARAFKGSGNYDAALAMLNTAAKKESGLAEVYREQGQVLDIKGDAVHAIDSFRKYLDLEPNALDREQVLNRIKELE